MIKLLIVGYVKSCSSFGAALFIKVPHNLDDKQAQSYIYMNECHTLPFVPLRHQDSTAKPGGKKETE